MLAFLVLLAAALIASPRLGAAGNGNFTPNTFCWANGAQAIGSPMELWMGVGNETAGMLVGHATLYKVGSQGYVRIDLADLDGDGVPDMFPFVATRIHIHFADTVAWIPHTKQGNPIPGQFEYNVVTDPRQTVYEIPVTFKAFGAIHLSVQRYGGIEGFNFWLPDNQVTLRIVDYPSPGDPTYFRLKVTNGGFISTYDMGYGEGVYEGWCVDVDHVIYENKDYPAYLFSSYEQLPSWLIGPGLIEYPENLDLVNYLVNKFKTGDVVQPVDAFCNPVGSPEALTYGDIQMAIWSYIENSPSSNGIGTYSPYRVNAIRCEVAAHGNNFVPACDEKVVFLVVPAGTSTGPLSVQVVIGQPVIGEIAVECTSAEGTAWGDGKYGAQFPGARQWGTYFKVNGACAQ
jgi:hypothetical protein